MLGMTFAKFLQNWCNILDNWVLASMGYDNIDEEYYDRYHDHQA